VASSLERFFLEKPSKRGGHSLKAELFDVGVLVAKRRILSVFKPNETGDTEKPLLFGEKGQIGGCAISARAVFDHIWFKNG
jgi:hypothetical protein